MNRLVVWGASGHAKVVAEIARAGAFDIVGFLDDLHPETWGREFCKARVLGGREWLTRLAQEQVRLIAVAIGDGPARLALAEVAERAGFEFPRLVHPRAIVSDDASIGRGSVVGPGAVVNAGARIGDFVIVNSAAVVEHDCVVEDGSHIAPGARLGGGVRVGPLCWIGIGATVRDRIAVGGHSLLGAGGVAVRDIPAGTVCYGVPARVVRARRDDAVVPPQGDDDR